MTPPMTPREKVIAILDEHTTVGGTSACKTGSVNSDELSGLILTTLASGSGDHAELARLAEDATPGPWEMHPEAFSPRTFVIPTHHASDDPAVGSILSRQDAAFIAAANPATVLALLAENAALRDEIETLTTAGIIEVAVRNPSVADYVRHWEGRATEAERKLAEAVSVLRDIAKGETPPEQHGHYLAHRQAVDAARTFLSEAHQAREQGRGIWQ